MNLDTFKRAFNQPAVGIGSLLLISVALLPSPLLAQADDPYSEEAIAKKDYSGITLNALTLSTPVLGEPFMLHAEQFEKLTGAKLNVNRVGFPEFYQETLLGLKKGKYDVISYGSMWIADVMDYLEPIPDEMLQSSQYKDVLPHYKSIASWGDLAVQVPIDGDRHYLQYRKDLLEDPKYQAEFEKATGKKLAIPRTWPELQEIARFFHGKKLADGSTISAP